MSLFFGLLFFKQSQILLKNDRNNSNTAELLQDEIRQMTAIKEVDYTSVLWWEMETFIFSQCAHVMHANNKDDSNKMPHFLYDQF